MGSEYVVIDYETFSAVEMRVGTIVAAEPFPEARKPAYRLTIDFGPEIGTKRSSAQITQAYTLDDLVGRQVVAVVNFPPKRIGPFVSECLVCGFDRAPGEVVLAQPAEPVPNGARLY
jgi:tRNA-binding protein